MEENRKVYGVRKLGKTAKRSGIDIGRDQTARLMRSRGIEGVKRSRRVKTAKPDPTAARHSDLVKRVFSSTAPNQLWVTDLTFVPTWVGVAYACFIIDAYSRMIVGWRVATHMKTKTVLDVIEMERWSRGKHLPRLRCHSGAGSQFTSIRYGERLAKIGAVSSTGSVGDSFDNALAETVNGYYKAELVRGPEHPGPWKTIEELELATLGWVHWHNNERLHGFIGDVPPAEFEETFYAATHQAQVLAENTTLGSLQNPGRFKPWRNGFVESFNWKLRDECLNVNQFYSLDHARGIIGIWKEEYNTIRPPSSLGYSTPSVYAGQCTH